MSYDTLEEGVQSAKPVELYRFWKDSGDSGVLGEPAPFGVTVYTEPWTYGSTADVYSPEETANWPATNVNNLSGGSPTGGTGGFFEMLGLYWIGPLGAGGGAVFHTHALTGLDPNCLYRVKIRMVRNRETGFLLSGIKVNVGYEEHVIYASGLDTWLVDYFRPPESGIVTISFGQFDLEYGSFTDVHLNITVYPIVVEKDCDAVGTPAVPNQIIYHNYTSADKDIVYLGSTYTPARLHRAENQVSGSDGTQDEIPVELDSSHLISQLFKDGVAPQPVGVQILRLDRDDLTDAVSLMIGEVIRTERDTEVTTLVCSSRLSRFKTETPRVLVQRTCPWLNGDEQCTVDREAFAFTGPVSAIVDRTYTVDGAGAFAGTDGTYFVNGVFRAADGSQWPINGMNGDDITLLVNVSTEHIAVGDEVKLYAGDDQTAQTCKARFNNIVRFGGFTMIRERSMFEGGGLS